MLAAEHKPEQILLALSESYSIVAAITKYQVFLASAIGLPKDDTGRVELMAASMTALEKIRTEIRALEHELDRREKQEPNNRIELWYAGNNKQVRRAESS